MNKGSTWLLAIGVLLIGVGIAGFVYERINFDKTDGRYTMYDNDENTFYRSGGMMMDDYHDQRDFTSDQEPYDLDTLTAEVEKYIANYDANLEISDIFVFKDSEYYYSIMEKDTGRGAMELLVNQYTKAIYPEYGPNMMWNLKYGMHYGSQMGGMGRGMMGYYNQGYDNDEYYINNDSAIENDLSPEEAAAAATKYLEENNSSLTLEDEYHAFYGYYTFHVEKDDQPYGMLSVNGFTGNVWYHTWHGELQDVIENHE